VREECAERNRLVVVLLLEAEQSEGLDLMERSAAL